MAPEQVEKRVYTKSVDVWACGIILYMLINRGKHPLHVPGDDYQMYADRLKAPRWVFSKKVSDMALNLFMNLTK